MRQVSARVSLSFFVASYYISTILAGDCMMANGSSTLPGHRGQIEPHEVSRPSHHLMAT